MAIPILFIWPLIDLEIAIIEGYSRSLNRSAIVTGTTWVVDSGYGNAFGATSANGKGSNAFVLAGFPTRNLIQTMDDSKGCLRCHRMDAPLPPGETMRQDVFTLLHVVANDAPAPAGFRQLTQGPSRERFPLWSPDGAHILYSVDQHDGHWNLWVMKADGSGARQLTRHPVSGWANWHPDGRSIVYGAIDEVGLGNIWKISIDGSQLVQLTNETMADRPEWSPNGTHIAYMAEQDGNWDVWMMDADGGNQRQLTTHPSLDGVPHWSPGGTQIAFKAMRNRHSEIYMITFARTSGKPDYTSEPRISPVIGPTYKEPDAQMGAWSPSGSKLAYTQYDLVPTPDGESALSYKVWVSDPDGSFDRLLASGLTIGDRTPNWRHDGKMVAFWAWDLNFNAGIWVAPDDGSFVQYLTKDFAADALYPSWSPLGNQLVFDSNRAGSFDIWMADLDGI